MQKRVDGFLGSHFVLCVRHLQSLVPQWTSYITGQESKNLMAAVSLAIHHEDHTLIFV